MPFERDVLIESTVYNYHKATMIAIETDGNTIFMTSWISESDIDDPSVSPKMSAIHMPDTEDFAAQELLNAEEWVVANGYFPIYENEAQAALDEILPILTDEQAEQVPNAFPEWKLDTDYTIGYRVRYSENLYKCLQNHTSQIGYEPPIAVSLWAKIGEPGTIPEWEQPGSTNPYMAGDLVRHNNKIWRSLIDNNVWEPGTPGTEMLWEEVQL